MSASTQQLAWTFAPSPNQNWTRRAYHASVVVGDYLYIDGGEVAVGSTPWSLSVKGPNYDLLPVNCTLVLALDGGWTDPNNVVFTVIEKPEGAIFDFSSLWYDETTNKSIYAFGGEQSKLDNHQLDLSVWRLDLDGKGGGTWVQNATAQSAPFSKGITRPSGGASTFSQDAAYYVGGYENSRTSPQTQTLGTNVPLPGLVSYNFTERVWTNSSQGVKNISPTGSFEFGAMEQVPFGPNGLLVMFGGETSNSSSYTAGDQERQMNTITLIDPVTNQWYQQNASSASAAPLGRSKFCTVTVCDNSAIAGANPPTGTCEIFMYGGYGGVLGDSGASQYDEVWILSLPAFTWQQVDWSHNVPRIGHSCNVVSERQMITIGGLDASQTDPWSTLDLTTHTGIGIFDMTLVKWAFAYNSSAAPYQRCSIVQTYYDKSGAYPATWGNPALQGVFAQSPLPKSNASSEAPAVAVTIAPPSGTSSHLGVIIGGSVAVVLLLLISLISSLCYIRRKRSRQRQQRLAISAPLGPPQPISELSTASRHLTGMSHHTLETKIMQEITRWNAPPPPRYCIEMTGGELDGGEVAREMISGPRVLGSPSKDSDEFRLLDETGYPLPVRRDSDEGFIARPPPARATRHSPVVTTPHPGNRIPSMGRPPPGRDSRKRSSVTMFSPLDGTRSERGQYGSPRSDVSPVEGRRPSGNRNTPNLSIFIPKS